MAWAEVAWWLALRWLGLRWLALRWLGLRAHGLDLAHHRAGQAGMVRECSGGKKFRQSEQGEFLVDLVG